MFAIDGVHKALGCIRLRWHTEDTEEGRYSASKLFGIVFAETILRHVHFVPADSALTLLDSKD